MGKALKAVLDSNPSYYMGLQPLAKNTMPGIISKYKNIKWINSDVFHDASINGIFNKFLSACDGKNIVLVAPNYIGELNKFIKTIRKHIVIPSVNCWLSKDKILKEINDYLKDKDKNHVVLFSASMMSNVLIDNLYKKYEVHSFLNMGSVFDPFLKRKIRNYHLKLDCKRTLLAITTFNHIEYTRKCLDSLKNSKVRNMDIVIFDDHSTDGTVNLDKEYDVKIITKLKGRGLTDSWNIAFNYFNEYDYNYYFLINNDVLIPNGAIEQMLILLKDNILVVPMTSVYGAGHTGKSQAISTYYDKMRGNNPNNTQIIQNDIQKGIMGFLKIDLLNGFFFGMNRNIKKEGIRFSGEYFFNPKNVNVGNDDEFNARLKHTGEMVTLCRKAFIYHFKDISFNIKKHGMHRNNLEYYQNVK